VVVGIVARVQRDECRGRTCLWEHADEDEIHVVDPFKCIVAAHIEPSICQQVDASLGCLEIRVELVINIFGRVDVGDWAFTGVRTGRDLDLVSKAIPVSTLRSVQT